MLPHSGRRLHREATEAVSQPNYGPCRDEEAALRLVVDRLVAGLHPFRIYLFGSRAEGRARPDSDFDLAVVFDDADPAACNTLDKHSPAATRFRYPSPAGRLFDPPAVDRLDADLRELGALLPKQGSDWRLTFRHER
jgi:predicted nucleotidyltransferase